MSAEAVRIPLTVLVNFIADGEMIPTGIVYLNDFYQIDKVKDTRKLYLGVIGDTCIEYNTIIGGHDKKLYYVPRTRKWYSVKNLQRNRSVLR